jgi:hypothetical protein
MVLWLALTASALAQPVSTAIKLDTFGYRPGDVKVAVFTANPGATVLVRDPDGAVKFTIPTDGGSIVSKGQDGAGSFDTVWWVDFSPVTVPGNYHLYSPSLGTRSYEFGIRADVYDGIARAALKTFYRQRCNTPKPAAYAGAWADGASCHASDQQTGPVAGHTDRGLRDLRGGWHDAGDYNKYVWHDASTALVFLLRAFEESPAAFGDDLGIPESGNGVPDVLDEVKWELDWMLKMQLPDGSVLERMHNVTFASSSPPSADPSARFYYDPTLESAGVLAGSAALASRAFTRVGMTAYAATLKTAALSSWTWLQTQGNDHHKAWAAAEIFRMDPTVTSARAYVDAYYPTNWAGLFFNPTSYDTHAALAYVQAPGATAAVVANMRASIGAQVDYTFDTNDLYRNGLPDWSHHWGSNRERAARGAFLLTAARLGATGSHSADESHRHGLDFFHYLHGQNAMSMTYLTNTAALGGEHSSWQVYHAWFGDSNNNYSLTQYLGKPAGIVEPHYPYFAGTDNHGINDNKISVLGPAPGFLLGGPNKDYSGDATPPLGAVGYNRFYRDWSDQTVWTARTWEITENSISYQSAYVALAAGFTALLRPPVPRTDFDGDVRADLAVYHPPSGLWYTRASTTGASSSTAFGGPDYTPVPGDYDGDVRTDLTVYHASSGLWFTRSSATGGTSTHGLGGAGYNPVRGDFDGDRKADFAVYHPSSGLWFVRQSSTGTTQTVGYGNAEYLPVPADYDGDGRADIAAYHPPTGLWFLRSSANGTTTTVGFGGNGYTPVRGDFDGDGRADVAAYHASSGLWFVRQSTTGTTLTVAFGGTAYAAVPGDYDGDGKTDIAVYHAPTGSWYVRSSATGTTTVLGFGGTGFDPIH